MKFLQRLAEIKAQFGGDYPAEKIALITLLRAARLRTVSDLLNYHESLCYLRAYGDSAELLRLVDGELNRFRPRLGHLKRPLSKSARSALERSGIVGTRFTHDFGLQMIKWVLNRFPGSADFDRTEMKKLKGDPILDLLPVLVTWAENDAVDDPYVSTEDFQASDIGRRKITSLKWFIDLYRYLPADDNLKRLIFDKIAFPTRITIGDSAFARTNARQPVADYFFQAQPLERGQFDLRTEVRRITFEPELLDAKTGREVIDRARMALLVRRRELWPLSYANEHEVWSARIGRGTTIYIMGMVPEARLPLEANYSALLVRNGVPIGYGVAAMVGERLELAINIFDTFRRCEAAFIYTNFLRLLHHLFGCTYLIIRRYQVGYDNPEGLESGAYWFYYKLGFRSLDHELRTLAETEARKIATRKGYRSSPATLKQLAESDLCLNLKKAGDYIDRDYALGQIALAQTRYIAEHFQGDRKRAGRVAPKLARRLLGIRSTTGWTRMERLWFERWSVLVCLLPGTDRWPIEDRKQLVAIMRAKGHPQEQEYIRSLRRQSTLARALRSIGSA